jgi:phage-related protein
MANPAPIYQVEFDSQLLPGYVQSDNRPISFRKVTNTLYGRDGGSQKRAGADLRKVSLTFRILSNLGTAVSDLLHLEDCMDQYRDALAILTRADEDSPLRIHDSDRYYLATVDSVSAPFSAGESRRISYDVQWTTQPWAYAITPVTDVTAGNGGLTFALDGRRTYPVYSVPSGVTAFTATDENGKVVEFTRGATTGTVTIDCGAMTVVDGSGVNAISTLDSLNFGQYWGGGAGTYDITVSGFAGSGTITVSVTPRYEL